MEDSKKIGRIETLLAKLAKDSKSRNRRVHMATVDEHPNSDNDVSEPEDGDFNSDNSLVESDSGNRGMNVYITHGKKK